jgi:hypothetical protein
MLPFLVFVTGAKVSRHAGLGSVKVYQFLFPAGKAVMQQFITRKRLLH